MSISCVKMFWFVSHVPHPGENTPTGGEEAQHNLSVTYSALPKNTGEVEGEQPTFPAFIQKTSMSLWVGG